MEGYNRETVSRVRRRRKMKMKHLLGGEAGRVKTIRMKYDWRCFGLFLVVCQFDKTSLVYL